MKRNRKGGFTLIEIMIVVLIIGLLAAIAIPSFARARETSRRNACINNLRQIDAAAEQYAMERNVAVGTATSVEDLQPYLKGNTWPVCPSVNQAYAPPAVGANPVCPGNISGHALP